MTSASIPVPSRRAFPHGCRGWALCAALLAPFAHAAAATPEPVKTGHHHHRAATTTPSATSPHHTRHRPAAAPATAHHHGHPADRHAVAHHHSAIPPHTPRTRRAAIAAAPLAAAAGAAAVAIPPAATPAEPPPPTDKGTITGLPLPRFAALRADEVNMRSGPGQRYPIEWVYHRRNLPVKIEREFDVWRLVEDSDGQKGWVHQATLVGTRSFVVPGLPPVDPAPATPPAAAAPPATAVPTAPPAASPPAGHFDSREVARLADPAAAATIPGAVMLRAAPDAGAALVAVLKPGTVGILHGCAAGTTWCRVSVQRYAGWLDRRSVWGLLPRESLQPS
ncbi:SH3 domain-containing protein [Gluconacetobacter sacchari]|nr:SH3 domain-containing protein [Gluconacetobacter sacchari]